MLKQMSLIFGLAILVSINNLAVADLILTSVFDGPLPGGLPKGIEVLATADIDDLAAYGIGSANNGGGSDGEEFTFPQESALKGQFIYIASEDFEFETFFGFPPDYVSGSMLINGDDAIEVFHDFEVIDVFGDIDLDGSGTVWDYADGWVYRKSQSGPDGDIFVEDNWTYSGPDALDGEFDNATAPIPVPIGTYMVASRGAAELQPGDSDEDLDFDQFDLIRVQTADKYRSGEPATWGEGDWDGAPGGSPGNAPIGNGFFDQFDVIAAQLAGVYLSGPYAAIETSGKTGDSQTSIIYHADTGEISVDAPSGTELTSINIDSAASIFVGQPALNLGGSFDNDADGNLFKATFGGSFGTLSFGNVATPGLEEAFLISDLTVVGSLAGGGDLGAVDLIYVPEPASVVLVIVALVLICSHKLPFFAQKPFTAKQNHH